MTQKLKKTAVLSSVLIAILILIVGCGINKLPDPVPIVEGVDKCEVCSMLIADDHNATQLILKDGRPLKFDDIGDLFVWTEEHGLDDVTVRYVRDYHTSEWIQLEKATFVYDESFETPMAFGIYSFKDEKDAESFVTEKGTGDVLSAAELGNHHWTVNMDMMHHDHDHGDHDEHEDHGDHGDHEDHEDHDDA